MEEVSRTFDPIGLFKLSVMLAEVLLQKLCQHKVRWDESLPFNLETDWRKLRAEFLYLNGLKSETNVVYEHVTLVEIHGFSDA